MSLGTDEIEFCRKFFGPGNRLRWETIQSSDTTVRDAISFWLEDLSPWRGRLLLPCIPDQPSGEDWTEWYAMVDKDKAVHMTMLKDELQAFVGASYAQIKARRLPGTQVGRVEKAVQDRFGHNYYRLVVKEPHLITVRDMLKQMQILWRTRPIESLPRVRPTGRILSDFEWARQNGDTGEMAKAISELRINGKLDAKNLLFLEIRLLAAERKWKEILEHVQRPQLVHMRRPRLVTEALIVALYNEHLKYLVNSGNVDTILRIFKEDLWPEFSPLFRTRAGMVSQDALMAFALSAFVNDPPSVWIKDLIESNSLRDADRHLISKLVQYANIAEKPEGVLSEAFRAFKLGDIDQAFDLTCDVENSPRRASLLLRCAEQMQSEMAISVAIHAMESLTGDERGSLLKQADLGGIWESLQQLPKDWNDWLEKLDAEKITTDAVEIAERVKDEWNSDDYELKEEWIYQFSENLMRDRRDPIKERLRQSLPFITECFLSINQARHRAFKPILEAISHLIILDSSPGEAQLSSLIDLIDSRIMIGVEDEEYRQIINDLIAVWDTHGAIRRLDLSLSVIDRLIELPCVDKTERNRYIYHLQPYLAEYWGRMSHAQRELFLDLCREIGIDFGGHFPHIAVPDVQAPIEEPLALLGEKSVAIYSLVESAAQRAQRIIGKFSPSAKISVYHDHVGSIQLKEAAQNADIFIIATYAAKHAATEFIEANRATDCPILRPLGKGTVSILRVISEHIKALNL